MASSAKESKNIAKVRNKLKKVLEDEKRQYTEEALKEMAKTIHQRIYRHQSERISIKDKSFRLFDENEQPAETKSKYVRELLGSLRNELKSQTDSSKLKGRVQYPAPEN